jgi:hypothetical protein
MSVSHQPHPCAATHLDSVIEGDYIDLTLNPERFTGYAGTSAARVWRSIYEENCFGQSEINMLSGKAPAPVSLPDSMSQVMREDGAPGECLEKRVYYKIISGALSFNFHDKWFLRALRSSCIHLHTHMP